MQRLKIFGPPGTGKTSKLLQIVDEALDMGTPPERIAFLAFTKKAAEEAVERAEKRFRLGKDRLPWFRTIHSMCFKQLGLMRDELMLDAHYRELGEALGFRFSWLVEESPFIHIGNHLGDKVARVDAIARLKEQSLKDTYIELGYRDCPWFAVNQFRQALETYKQMNGLRDYTDLLEDYHGALPVDILIVDEAQDLTQLQWRVVHQAWSEASKVYMAGDDDQCIFSWAGAQVDLFLGEKGAILVLPESFRLPRAVHELATKISHKIGQRQAKEWKPRNEAGLVHYISNEGQLDLTQPGKYLLLARTKRLLERWEKVCRDAGRMYIIDGQRSIKPQMVEAIYGWEHGRKGEAITQGMLKAIRKFTSIQIQVPQAQAGKLTSLLEALPLRTNQELVKQSWMSALDLIPSTMREYVRSCLAKGEKLREEPRIKISTIHRVKGGEAEHVGLLLDVNKVTWEGIDTDEELRVLYVAVTRAKNTLTLVRPSTLTHYRL